MRGNLPRTQTKQNAKKTPQKTYTKYLEGKKKIEVINLIRSMFPYSERNKQVNSRAENSTLNPDTNSLSPSAKSKGARFVSAKQDINHIRKSGKNIRTYV